MEYIEIFNKFVTLFEGINSLSELMDSDKLPSWMFLVGFNLNYNHKQSNEDKEAKK